MPCPSMDPKQHLSQNQNILVQSKYFGFNFFLSARERKHCTSSDCYSLSMISKNKGGGACA